MTINIIESNAKFFSVTVINPVNTDKQTTNLYIGQKQEYHYMSTTPVLNSNTYEMSFGNEPIQKSASSTKSKLEQCIQRQFSQDKHAQLANRDKENCFIVVKMVTSSSPYMMGSLNDRTQANILLS